MIQLVLKLGNAYAKGKRKEIKENNSRVNRGWDVGVYAVGTGFMS